MTLSPTNRILFALALFATLALGNLLAGEKSATDRMSEIKARFSAEPIVVSSTSAALIDPLDCDSLADSLRTLNDTVELYSTFGMPGDTIDLEFYIKNDSFLAAFSLLYTFDTSLLEPILFPDTIIDCSGGPCDTTIDYYIWTWQGDRAVTGGFTTLGKYQYDVPTVGRVFAIPLAIEIDSVAPGGDVLCGSRFRVKETAQPGCLGGFEFVNFPVWGVDTTTVTWDSVFYGCLLNEFAETWEDYPQQVVPQMVAGYFKVGSDTLWACGDANSDGKVTVGDVTFLIATIFTGGPSPCTVGGLGDVNCDGKVSIADVTYLITRIFSAGPAPCCPDF
jgi:hypothetical protein